MIGNYLEQSLQLVDPSVCLHYMDYTKYFENSSFIDRKYSGSSSNYELNGLFACADLSNQNDGGTWTPMLTEKWFGSNDPATGRILGKLLELFVMKLVERFNHH